MKLTIKYKKETDMLTIYESVKNITSILKDVEKKKLTFKGTIENDYVEAEVDTYVEPDYLYHEFLSKIKGKKD